MWVYRILQWFPTFLTDRCWYLLFFFTPLTTVLAFMNDGGLGLETFLDSTHHNLDHDDESYEVHPVIKEKLKDLDHQSAPLYRSHSR